MSNTAFSTGNRSCLKGDTAEIYGLLPVDRVLGCSRICCGLSQL